MDKHDLQQRLSGMQVLDRVLPTAPLSNNAAAAEIRSMAPARALRTARAELDVDAIRAASTRYLREAASDDVVERNVTASLLEEDALQEQVIAFARVGLALFEAPQELVNSPPSERRAAGASGVVTRVVRDDKDRVLLETEKAIVRFEDGVDGQERSELLGRFDAVEIDSSGLPPRVVRVLFTRGRALDRTIEMLGRDEIVFAEPDFIEHVGIRHRPSDPDYSLQWHHRNAQTTGADISVEGAWDHVRGTGVVAAVVDNGFDAQHPDLQLGGRSAWYRQTPFFDDADFVGGTAGMPSQDHGTACAGMLAAIAENGAGGCGVAFDATLQVIACAVDQISTQSTLARAIAYAANPALETAADEDDGADVIACSLGPNGAAWSMRQVLSDAIDYVVANGRGGRGTPVFWACTNGNYPIALDEVCSHSSVIAVGRSTSTDQDDGSGYGPELAFLAPGVDVHIPAAGGGYSAATGTSFACPCAAGVGALVLQANPAYTYQQVRAILADNCDRVGNLPYVAGRNDRFGAGRVNAARAVAAARAAATGT